MSAFWRGMEGGREGGREGGCLSLEGEPGLSLSGCLFFSLLGEVLREGGREGGREGWVGE